MSNVISLFRPIDIAKNELHKKYVGKSWYHSTVVLNGIIVIYHKKHYDHREWLSNDDTYKGFAYQFKETIDDPKIDPLPQTK